MISLQKGWQFKEAGKSHWYPAAVSGCVHTDLLNNSLIPDPFYRDNETKLQWIGQTNWEYRTKFNVEPEMLRHKQIDLLFKGLDTYAAVFLNDLPILEADNMFREWRVPCKDKLRAGENTLRIMFRSPVNEILPKIKDLPYTLPAGNEQEFKTSPYTRKEPYQYGWDWGPRFVTMGIWQPVYLDVWNDAHLSGVWIQQKNLSKKTAELCAQVELHAMEEGTFQLVIQDEDHSFEPVVKTIRVSKGKHIDTVGFSLPNPKLWWPNGMGEPFLYTIEIKLLQNNQEIDRTTVRTGLRTLELRRKTDRWGKSFEFVVNGSPVFARGGNWIPADNFPNRVTEENYRHLLKSCKEAHMNMLRVWGGGFYENDIFYDLCDEMGILIWQDFMFACSLYPGDAAFLENIRREAVFQVKRLRTHPSLALWCGNNEMEAGWSEWGWKTEFPKKVWEDYKKIFHGILPEVCRTFDPDCPYWPSSPSSNLEDTPSSQKTGDIHYWDVWHGEKPFEFYKKQFPRFMSEYGFQSFPAFETVKSFTRPEDWKLDSPVMLLHQKNKGGNQHIHN
ncbi:MAG TPA: glycoside hydrolase family 2 protein, partial [Bacteroidetes bacterium]|nr:glycoside hydrolase family 2 protein [Bacteroidota bacterium]